MRLIDADALIGSLNKLEAENGNKIYRQALNDALHDFFPQIIAAAPTISPPPNDPLTILELREMDGEPVWNDTTKEWAIVDTHFRATINVNGCWRPFSDRYYRRKPEEWEDENNETN